MWPRRNKEGVHDSARALEDATQQVDKVKDRQSEVHEVASALRHYRERNHFAEQIADIMGGHPQKGPHHP